MSDRPEKSRPRAPSRLKSAAAKAFWKQVIDTFEVDPNELVLLRQAVRIIDTIEALQAAVDRAGPLVRTGQNSFGPNPALVERRQQQAILARLLATLRLPEDWVESERRPQRRGSARGAYGPRALRAVE